MIVLRLASAHNSQRNRALSVMDFQIRKTSGSVPSARFVNQMQIDALCLEWQNRLCTMVLGSRLAQQCCHLMSHQTLF